MYAGNCVCLMFTHISTDFYFNDKATDKKVCSDVVVVVVIVVVVAGFLMTSSTNSATKTTGASKSDPEVATRKSATPAASHLSPPVTH